MAEAIIAIAAAIFVAGVAVGVIVLVSVGIRREERDFLRTGRVSLTRQAPGRVSHGARSLNGVYVRQPVTRDPTGTRWQDTLV
jgi:hypothetical protein